MELVRRKHEEERSHRCRNYVGSESSQQLAEWARRNQNLYPYACFRPHLRFFVMVGLFVLPQPATVGSAEQFDYTFYSWHAQRGKVSRKGEDSWETSLRPIAQQLPRGCRGGSFGWLAETFPTTMFSTTCRYLEERGF